MRARAGKRLVLAILVMSYGALLSTVGCAILDSGDLHVAGDEQARGARVFVDGKLAVELTSCEPADADRLWIWSRDDCDSTSGPEYLYRKGQLCCVGFKDYIAQGEHEVRVDLADGRRVTTRVKFEEYTDLQIRGHDGRLASATR